MLAPCGGWAQEDPALHNAMSPISPDGPLPEPFRIGSPLPEAQTAPLSQAALLYRNLANIHLDPQQFHHIRDASIEREDIQINLDDGDIAFSHAVDGRITGAFFKGEGEILLIPPDRVERRSLGLFTGSAILEERFTSAFFRFNDNFPEEIAGDLRPSESNAQAFVDKWDTVVNSLGQADALRLLTSFLNAKKGADGKLILRPGDDMFRARFVGVHLGIFDLFFDTSAREQISVGQLAHDDAGNSYFNVWAAFPMRSMRKRVGKGSTDYPVGVTPAVLGSTTEEEPEGRIHIDSYKINVNVKPPTDLDGDCTMQVHVIEGGDRVLLFELSRYLKVSEVESEGQPIEFLQNEALEGTALARRGNDLVAVIFPHALNTGQSLQLRFVYGGSVMSDAGGGLLYVGARGIWFPNRGISMANFDMQFTYPSAWTLVATGRQVSEVEHDGIEAAHWVSERPIPLAGFNLGHYRRAVAKGKVPVEVYASEGVETGMEVARQNLTMKPFSPMDPVRPAFIAPAPEPASNAQSLANNVEKGLKTLSEEMGPYPYSQLVLSQMPGSMSQGWPGLIFLSSYSFLSTAELAATRLGPSHSVFFRTLMPLHEAAHNWWGDLIVWKSYRDQWLVEALANYCALVAMEQNGQERQVQNILDSYRRQLLSFNHDKRMVGNAGPVTLGVRLDSSYFPHGYNIISYGRGTWLFNMLRHMMDDAPDKNTSHEKGGELANGPFFRALRRLREQNQGKYINNRIVQQVFEAELPKSLRYEGKESLDWFFDDWVNGTSIPKIELSKVKVTSTRRGTIVSGRILQEDAPEELVTSVPIYAATRNGMQFLGRVFADGSETNFRLSGPAGIKKIQLDPYHTILRR